MQREVSTYKPYKHIEAALRAKQVAAYARVSSGKDSMLHSLSAQVSYYSALIQRTPGWKFMGVYADEATTGTKDNREKFQCLLADCRTGKVDMIITKSVSRFARNTITTLQTIRELRRLGIDVFFEEQNIHTLGNSGDFLLTLLAAYAQEESRAVSENLKWRIREKYKRGEPGSITMYGYKLIAGVLQIVPEEAEVIRLVADLYLEGKGNERISQMLNKAGIPAKYGGKWNAHIISEMLMNEKMVGDMLLQKTYVPDPLTKKSVKNNGVLPQYYVTDCHEGILDRDTYESVCAEHDRRVAQFHPRPIKRTAYPFSGRLVCGKCGARYRRKIASAGSDYEKPIWICQTFNTAGKAACPSQQIPERILHEVAAQVLGLSVFDAEVFEKQIVEIRVPENGTLIFVFTDGREIKRKWENPSRRESWTADMRHMAAEKTRQRHQRTREVSIHG